EPWYETRTREWPMAGVARLVSVALRAASADGDADVFHHLADVLRWWLSYLGDGDGRCKVNCGPNCAKGVEFYSKEPIGGHVPKERRAGDEHDPCVLKYIQQGDRDAGNHAGDSSGPVDRRAEYPHHQCWEDG